jgi:hypothetical protein
MRNSGQYRSEAVEGYDLNIIECLLKSGEFEKLNVKPEKQDEEERSSKN